MTDFARRYRDMSDYRLAQLAADPNALVPNAREALRAEIARRPPPTVHKSAEAEKLESAKGSLDGVAGWLAWYCFGLFGGVYNEIRFATSLHGGISNVTLAFSIFSFGIAAWNLATGICIIRRAPFALRMIAVQLIAGGLQGLIIGLAGTALLAFSPRLAGVAASLIGLGLAICAGYAIWLRYFQVSKRVNITFGRNL